MKYEEEGKPHLLPQWNIKANKTVKESCATLESEIIF